MFTNIPLITNLPESKQLSWDMAKQIIQSQSNLAIFGISVLVGVAILVMAASWLWNFYLHKREIEKVIESFKSEIDTKVEESLINLTERIKDQVKKMRQEIEKSVEERLILFDAQTARLFALVNTNSKAWDNAAVWWATAIGGYGKTGDERMVRICVDALNGALNKCEVLEDVDKNEIKACLPAIPRILNEEREKIEDRLNSLPNRIKKKSDTE